MSTKPIAKVLATRAQTNANIAHVIAGESRSEIGDEGFGAEAGAAIEKWLKALIAWRGRRYNRDHDIGDLFVDVQLVGYVIPSNVDVFLADSLTPYAGAESYESVRLTGKMLDRRAVLDLLDAMNDWVDGIIT